MPLLHVSELVTLHTRLYWPLMMVFVTPHCNFLLNCLCHLINCDPAKAETRYLEDDQSMPDECWGQMPPLMTPGSSSMYCEADWTGKSFKLPKVTVSKGNENVPPGARISPKAKYISKEQIKLFRKLFTRLQPPREPLTSAFLEIHGRHSTFGCVFNKMRPDRPCTVTAEGVTDQILSPASGF